MSNLSIQLPPLPSVTVERAYESGALDREDPDVIVREYALLLGWPADSLYADSMVQAHRTRRHEFQTGHPF